MIPYSPSQSVIEHLGRKYNFDVRDFYNFKKSGDLAHVICDSRGYAFYIQAFYNDCTAINLSHFYSFMKEPALRNLLSFIQEFMSASGKINAFFTIKCVGDEQAKTVLSVLREFNCVGLNLQIGNRDEEENVFMLSGIMKCTNPVCHNYNLPDLDEYIQDSASLDLKYNKHLVELNAKFGLLPYGA